MLSTSPMLLNVVYVQHRRPNVLLLKRPSLETPSLECRLKKSVTGSKVLSIDEAYVM